MASVGFSPGKPSLTFLLAFVRGVDASLNEVESLWGTQHLSAFRFTHMVSAFVFHSDDGAAEGSSSTGEQSQLLHKALPEVPTLQASVLWEKRMYAVHNYANSMKDPAEVESFENVEHLMYCVFGIFSTIAQKPKQEKLKEISFHDFRAFVLNITIGGKNGVDDNEVKPITLTRSPPCKALYRMNKLKLLEETNVLLSCIHVFGDNGAQLRMMDASSLDVTQSLSLKLGAGNINALECCQLESENSYARVRLVFLCSGDGFCRAYDYYRLRVMKIEVDMQHPTHMIKYLPKRNLMTFGNTKGVLTFADLTGMERFAYTLEISRSFNVIKKLKLHEDSITALETDHYCDAVFTSGLDRMIYQVHLKDFSIVRRLSGHQLGVHDVAYNHHYNTLVSCGMDYALYVWTLEATNVEPNLMVDSAHPYHNTIVQVETVESKPFVVSMDTKGLMKVWDVRTMRCVCSVACEPDMVRAELENLTWHCFVLHKKNYDVISAANRKIYIFEYDVDDRGLGSYCAHEGSISGACYEPRTRTLISCAKTEVQVWNAANAKSINRVREVTRTRITTALLLEGSGTLVLATDDGHVKFISTASFAVLAESIHGAGQAISNIAPLPAKDGVVAVAVSGHTEIIHFNSKTGAVVGQTLERKEVPIRASYATCLKSTQGSFVLVGDHQNVVSIWIEEGSKPPAAKEKERALAALRRKKRNYYKEHSSRQSSASSASAEPASSAPTQWAPKKYVEFLKAYNYPADRPVVAIAPIPKLSSFISIDNRGWFNMWAVDHAAEQTWSLAKWVSRRPPELRERPLVTKAVVCEEMMLLYTGDDFGQVCCYDISVALGRTDLVRQGDRLSFKDVPAISAPRGQLIPPLVTAWEAHPESSVTELFVVRSPLCIVSGGDDCRLQAMSLGGTPISMFIMRKVGQIIEEQYGIDYKGLDDVAPVAANAVPGTGGIDDQQQLPTPAGDDGAATSSSIFVEKYNDLPAPYGAGLSLVHSKLNDRADELMQQQERERQLLKEAELTRGGSGSGGGANEAFEASLMSGSMFSLMSKSTLRSTKAPDVPFWKVGVPKLGAAPKTKTIERAPTLILPSKEILYSVPQYIGLDKVEDPSRPKECHYAPALSVDHAMYGPDSNFWQMNHEATKLAKTAMKDAQEQEHKLALVVNQLSAAVEAEEQHHGGGGNGGSVGQDGSPGGRHQSLVLGSPAANESAQAILRRLANNTPPPATTDGGQPQEADGGGGLLSPTTCSSPSPQRRPGFESSFGVGDKDALRQCSKEAFVDWQKRVTSENQILSEQERRRDLARQLAEIASPPKTLKPLGGGAITSPTHANTNTVGDRASPLLGKPPVPDLRRAQSVSEGMFASPKVSAGPGASDPRSGGGGASRTPPPMGVNNTQQERKKKQPPSKHGAGGGGGAKQRAIQKSVAQLQQSRKNRRSGDLEYGLPEGMVVPQVRSLAGNKDHVKSHSNKPF